MNITQHLKELLKSEGTGLVLEDASDMHTYVISYKNFCEQLHIEYANKEGDKYYLYLFRKQTSLKSDFAKIKGKETLFSELMELYHEQYQYYENKIEKEIIINEIRKSFHNEKENEIIENNSYDEKELEIIINEVKNNPFFETQMIIMEEKEKNVIGDKINGVLQPDQFMVHLKKKWEDFIQTYEKVLEIFLSGDFSQDVAFYESIIQDEKNYYFSVKDNKKELRDDVKNNNFKKNLYLYARNQYLLHFFEPDLPNMVFFKAIKNYEYCKTKETYTLRDVAELYQSMINSDKDQYENMKKVLQKKKYFKKFKKDNNRYSIRNEELSEMIVAYMFLKKKDTKEDEYSDEELDDIIRKRYTAILNLLMRKDIKQTAFLEKLFKFYHDEFVAIFTSLNGIYQETMFEVLLGGMERIYTRSIGADRILVY